MRCLDRKARERGHRLRRPARFALVALAAAANACAATAAPFQLNLDLPLEFDRSPAEPLPSPLDAPPPDRRPAFALKSDSDAPHNGFAFATGAGAMPELFRFTGGDGATQTVSIRAKDVQLDPGALDLAAAFGQRSMADDVTVERLMAPGAFEAENVSTLYAGAKGTWFKHVSLNAALAVSETRAIANAAFRDVDPAAAARELNAGAVWLGTRVDLGDTKDLKWTLVAQFGDVEKGFRAAGTASARPEGAVAIVGERTYAMTRLSLGDVALSAAAQTHTRDEGDMALRRVTVGHDWGNVSVSTRDTTLALTGRATHTEALAVELYPTEIAPEAGAMAPTLISFEWAAQSESGDITSPDDHRRILSLDAAWSTGLGETVVSIWQSTPDDAAQTQTGGDTLIDASHSVNWRDWRLSAGVTQMAFDDGASADTTLAGHGGIAYRPADGLNIECSLQRSRNEILDVFEADPLTFDRLDMRVAIDAAPLLRAVFDLNAVTAKFEYRQTIDRDNAPAAGDTDATALATTFAVPL
jgi:hypothetical protein